MTSRRQILALLAGASLPGLLAAQQAGRQPRVGVLMSGNRTSAMAWLQAFRAAVTAQGIRAAVELRFADGKADSLPALAAELTKRGVAMIVATDEAAFKAAKSAVSVPVLVGNIATPVDNAPQEIDILSAFLPKLSRISVLVNPANSTHRPFFNAVGAAAERKGWRALGVELEYPNDFEPAFENLRANRIGAVVIADDGLFSQTAVYLAELARSRRMATVGQQPSYANAGCLFSCGEDPQRFFPALTEEVERLLKGGKPAERSAFTAPRMPVIVNGRTAKALGVAIPLRIQKFASVV